MVKIPPSTTEDMGSIPGWGTKILPATGHGKKKQINSDAKKKKIHDE